MPETYALQDKKNSEGIRELYYLTVKQIIILILLGLIFWYLGTISVRVGSALGAFGSKVGLFTYVVGLLIGLLTVFIVKASAKLSTDQIIPGCFIGGAVATFFDGIAITWAPWLYGTDPTQISLGAAWILWGVFSLNISAMFVVFRITRKNNQ